MTANRRILLNVMATYGRSLYALVIGLIAGRWTLASLGEVDYGLYGLVGGMSAFVAFLNSLMAQAVSRFYAFAVGEARSNPTAGLEECRRWFNVAVTVHTVLPLVLVCVGYPLGVWAIEGFLEIPPDRLCASVWVWRFTCVSCLVSMMTVPCSAMYAAKQEIAELTVYGVVSTTVNFLFLCYMITHPGTWLVRYAAWACFVAVVPALIIAARALQTYAECRIVRRYLWDKNRARELFGFAAGRFLCALALMVQGEGRAILVNKYLGPAKNAAMAIGTTLTGQATMLMGAMSGAFGPAVTNAYGSGDLDGARALCLRMCKFGTLSVLVFAAPLMVEADNVLELWLKTPPAGSAILCVLLLIEHCISRLVDGHVMIVFANGKIGGFNATECVGYLFGFALMWLFVALGLDIAAIGLGAIACTFYTVPVKLYYARKLGGLPVLRWVRDVAVPLSLVVLASVAVGLVVRQALAPSFLRVCLTTTVCELAILPLAWFAVLDAAERQYVKDRVSRLRGRLINERGVE